jgi:hypothetical protein
MLEIGSILTDLAISRPIFHSEADFQHALAWKLQGRFPTAKIRLEVARDSQHIDILFTTPELSVIF